MSTTVASSTQCTNLRRVTSFATRNLRLVAFLVIPSWPAQGICTAYDHPADPCRYPEGDSWCLDRSRDPYAYADECLRANSAPTQDTPPTPGDKKALRPRSLEDLTESYGRQISYDSVFAGNFVENFEFRCPQPGRVLPLYGLLLARIAAEFDAGRAARMDVLSRGEELRIYEVVTLASGSVSPPLLQYQINAWGEVQGGEVLAINIAALCRDQGAQDMIVWEAAEE